MDEMAFVLIPLAILLALVIGSVLGFVAIGRIRRLTDRVENLSSTVDWLADRLAAAEERLAGQPATPAEPTTGQETAPPPIVVEALRPAAAAAPAAPPERVEELEATVRAEPVEVAAPAAPVPSPPEPEPPAEAARSRPGLEEALGTRWAVWIGGLALALGGVFLVRYSIEAGLIGPGARVVAGFAFAAALLAAGERLRRSGAAETPAGRSGAYVPGVLTGAGIVAAFATTYAAYALYGFIGGTGAFLALGAVAGACLALSVLHGPAIAALGLAASYLTPFLVSSREPALAALSAYLVAVGVATLAVARIRGWRWLAVTGSVGAVLWSMFMTVVAGAPAWDGLVVAVFTAASFAIALVAFVTSVHPFDPPRAPGPSDRVAVAVLAAFALAVLVHVAGFGTGIWSTALYAGFGAAAMTAAYGHGAVRWLVPFGIAVVLLSYATIAVPPAFVLDPVTGLAEPAPLPLVTGAPAARLIGTGILLGLLFAALGLLGVARSGARAMLAIGGAAVPLGLAVVAYLLLSGFAISVPFGFAALALAVFFAASAEASARKLRQDAPGIDGTVAAYAVATVAAVAAGLSMMFERGVLTIALAAIVPALAAVEAVRPVRALRPLALAVSAVVAVRFVIDPEVVGRDLGTTPIFNWLLWGYGAPAVAFALAAWQFGRIREDRTVYVLEALAVTFVALTAIVLIHHAMTGGDLGAPVSGLVEQALQVMVLMAVSLGMQWLSVRRPSPVFGQGTLAVGGLGLLVAGIGLLVVQNPAVSGEPVTGGANDWRLALGYLGPAALSLLLAVVALRRPDRPTLYAAVAAGLSGCLAFTWVTLAIRAAWHTGDLRLAAAGIEEGELYAYSVAWLACAIALLGAGVVLRFAPLRMVAAGLVAAVVAKVFLVDTAGLTGALRAVSFIGLGLVLVLVGLGYQKLLRTRPPDVSPR
jgi:uncharacterized membrane protein